VQERFSLSQLERMAPASRDIHTIVIVTKFNFAKDLATPSLAKPTPYSCRTEAENIRATKLA
jgi:hypothetical protein